MKISVFAVVAGLALALPAEAQIGGDRVVERRAGEDYAAVETDFDFETFVGQYKGPKVATTGEFRSRLTKNDVCGRKRDGVAGAPVDSMCAILLTVYAAPGGVQHVFLSPIFALEAPDIGRNAQASVQSALVIGPRDEPALVKLGTILPAAGAQPPNLQGQKVEGAFSYAYVIGKSENGKAGAGQKLPEMFFDHRYHLK